jgi:hypothetical protein
LSVNVRGRLWTAKLFGGIFGGIPHFRVEKDTPMPLTDTTCRSARPADKPYKLSDGGGLFLYVAPTGGKLWRLKYRVMGREQLLSFGAYPTVSLAEARGEREKAKQQLTRGQNPSLERKRAAVAATAAADNTFGRIAEELIAKREREGMASTTAGKLRWYLSLLGKLGERPIGQIEAIEVLAPLRKIEASGRHESAINAHAFAGRVFRFAVATGRAKRDVAADLRGALTAPKVKHHAAMIEPEGVGRLLRTIEAYAGQRVTKLALQMLAHTFPRPGELRFATWAEFDLGAAVWRIPAERTKMRKPHVIPLSRQALAILVELQAITGGATMYRWFVCERGWPVDLWTRREIGA